MHEDSHSEVVKREQSQDGVFPVFGLQLDGQDIHFAYTGQDADGNAAFKMGHGPGPETEENKRRIKSRDSSDGIPLFNDYYFSSGGLDILATSDIDNANPDVFPDVSSNDFDYAWIYDQVLCLFGASDPRATQGGNYPSQFDSVGLWFQVYDSEDSGTLAAGTMAPFSSDTPSLIKFLTPSGGLEVDTSCSTFHG